MTNFQAALFGALIGGIITLVVALIFHILSARGVREIPGRVVDLLIERGLIKQGRESEARGLVAERYYSRPYRIILPFFNGQSELPEGFKFPPTDVSGKQVLGPDAKPSDMTYTGQKEE